MSEAARRFHVTNEDTRAKRLAARADKIARETGARVRVLPDGSFLFDFPDYTPPPAPEKIIPVSFMLTQRMRYGLRRSLEKGRNVNDWESFVDYTLDDLRAHLEARFVANMSWAEMSLWHIDHIRPLASFNITGPDCPEFKAAWALSNLQPLWAADNLKKGARWPGK
jgi:hypothetical protein